MKVVPQAFYSNSKVSKIFLDGLCCVLRKRANTSDRQNQRYLATHALTYVFEGGLQIESFEGEICRVPKRHLVFLPKGLYMISDIIPGDRPFEAMVFFFDEDLTNHFLQSREEEEKEIENQSLLVFPENEDLRLFADNLIALYSNKSEPQFTRPKLLEFLHLISLADSGEIFVNRLMALKKMERKSVKAFMDEHFDKPLDIQDYAYLTGRSISSFHRDFKRKYRMAPKRWLIEKRLRKAAQLLRYSAQPVNEIMLAVGYENLSHFIKAFRKKFGLSPKQFQLKYRKNLYI